MPDQINKLLFLYTESSLHAGTGSSVSAVDLPIQRERATQYPLVQSSGVKGALRSQYQVNDEWNGWIEVIFGPPPKQNSEEADRFAGAISVGDAQIVLFPVRSLSGVFAYTTSHLALARLARLTNAALKLPPVPGNDQAWVTTNNVVAPGNRLVLEEFSFATQPQAAVDEIAKWLADNAFPNEESYGYWQTKVQNSLVVLPDEAFRDFVVSSTEIVTHIRLDKAKKTVEKSALWTEEALPADTLLVSPIVARESRWRDETGNAVPVQEIDTMLRGGFGSRIQLGGDETTGQGIVALRWS